MRTALPAGFALLGGLAFVTSGPAAGVDPVNTPVASEQRVTVPSLPGQPNKDAVVRPSGSLKTDSAGWVDTKPEVDASTPRPASSKPSPAGGAPAAASLQKVGPAPSTPATATGRNTISIRGVVESVAPAKSVTIRRPSSGSVVTYALAPGATIPAGLKPGESVRLRVLALENDRVADRVERLQKP